MKVKVSYTARYEDVPTIVEDILSSCRDSLVNSAPKLRISTGDFNRMHDDFKEAQDRIEVVHSQLTDVLNIVSGWLETEDTIETPQSEHHHEEIQAPPLPPDHTEYIAELRSVLEAEVENEKKV